MVRGADVEVVARAAVKVAREVGVEDLEVEALVVVTGLVVEVFVVVDLLVGVEGLLVDLVVGVEGLLVDLELHDEDGLLSPLTELGPEAEDICVLSLFLEIISSPQFPSRDLRTVGRELGASS